MLSLREVKANIDRSGIVDLANGLAFPLGTPYEVARDKLKAAAAACGHSVKTGRHWGHHSLLVFPGCERGYWRLIWRDYHLEINRFMPETQLFRYPKAAAPAT